MLCVEVHLVLRLVELGDNVAVKPRALSLFWFFGLHCQQPFEKSVKLEKIKYEQTFGS